VAKLAYARIAERNKEEDGKMMLRQEALGRLGNEQVMLRTAAEVAQTGLRRAPQGGPEVKKLGANPSR